MTPYTNKMGSPNLNNAPKHARGMPRIFSCRECGLRYAMEWAKNNHQRRCEEKNDRKNT
jgi:hypothetical protein